eukprot:9708292-Alexandrium_andersonii.AAC.1
MLRGHRHAHGRATRTTWTPPAMMLGNNCRASALPRHRNSFGGQTPPIGARSHRGCSEAFPPHHGLDPLQTPP